MFKKGDLVYCWWPNLELRGYIGVVLRDIDEYRSQVHFANATKFKTRDVLKHVLKRVSK